MTNLKQQAVFAVGVVVFILASYAGASQRPDETNSLLRLEDYLREAALNNAALRASFQTWKAALESVPQARALPDPKFTYGYFIREVETRVGPQRQKFELMQTFPWFGVIKARTDRAAANANAAHKRYEAKKIELFQQVKHAFYEYGYLAKAIQITGESLDLIKHFEQVARTKYAGATSTHPDVIRAQIELAILEDRLKSLKELRPAITAELKAILNRPADANLPWPQPPQYQPLSISFPDLYALIIQNNPDLKAVDYEIEAMRNAETLAKKKSLPDIGIGLSYIDTAHAMASGARDSGKDPVIAMVSLNLPIWTESYKAAERQAKAELAKTRHDKIDLENTLGAEARRLLYEFDDTARKIRLYRDIIIPKTREMVLASESAYEAATIDFLSLIDAQDKLLNYELLYERAAAENAQNLAKLERIAGTSLPTTNVDAGSEKENDGAAK
ncbi:MAG: TolC family protein [Sedimentisphaerales bacterium]|nr:TolC family protein [Sedimentisphaerales bacterium]